MTASARPSSTPTLDLGSDVSSTLQFIRSVVKRSGAKGVVVGVSGGVDSAVVLALCVRALGQSRVTGVLMPANHTKFEDMRDAKEMCRAAGVETLEAKIGPVVDAFRSAVGIEGSKLAEANIQARARMVVLYYVANSRRLLVAGTGDRSEIEIGFFTKYGDGAADFLPIGHLFKTEVRAVAEYLGVPPRVAQKPSSPGLWEGHLADDEIPVGYEKLDVVLRALVDEETSPQAASRIARVPLSTVRRVMRMMAATQHKRALPPTVSKTTRPSAKGSPENR